MFVTPLSCCSLLARSPAAAPAPPLPAAPRSQPLRQLHLAAPLLCSRYGGESHGGRGGGSFGGRGGGGRGGGGDRYGDSNFQPRGRGGARGGAQSDGTGDSWEALRDALGMQKREAIPLEFVKKEYVPHEEVASMTAEEVAAWRKEQDFHVSGDVLAPIRSFDHAPLNETVKKVLSKFPAPTPIQAQAWPILLNGKDLIGRAETGSGKTLAFGVPVIEHVLAQPSIRKAHKATPHALVIAPTRELADQISSELREIGSKVGIRVAVVYGGQGNRRSQMNQLLSNPQIVVATPGRLLDFLNEGMISAENVSQVILDEADRMLDMGFEQQITTVFGLTQTNRQTMMFSATWPVAVDRLASKYLTNPANITVGTGELKASRNVTQYVQVVNPADRIENLIHLLEDNPDTKMLVFAGKKTNCDVIGRMMYNHFDGKLKFAVIHGDKSQQQREAIIEDFKEGYLRVVVATDLASRGLDVKDIDVVVNYEMANSIEDYIHRIGRTGRAGAKGSAMTYFTAEHARLAPQLVEQLREVDQEIPAELIQLAQRQRRGKGGGGGGGYRRGGGRGGRGGGGGGRNNYGDSW